MKIAKHLFFPLIVCFLFFLPFFLNRQIITSKNNDIGRNYMPLFSYLHDSFVNYKQIPLWRTDQMMGNTFVGDPLSSLFYPANIIFLFLPTKFAITLYLFFDFVLASVFTFFLARSFKLSNLAAMSAAIFYTFSTKMLVHFEAGHATMITAFAFIPLCFLAFKKLQEKFSTGYLMLGSFALAVIYFEYPTIFYYTSIFLLAYFVYELIPSFQISGTKIITLIIFFAATFGLVAIALFPNLEFSPLSTRTQLKLEDVAIPLWNFKKFFLSLFFPYPVLTKLTHEEFLYFGIVPSVLSAIGFLKLPKYTKITLIIFGFLTILFVLGLSTPLFPLAYKFVPLLSYSRVTTRVWIIVALLVSLLAAKALDSFKNIKLTFLLVGIFLYESIAIFSLRFSQVSNLSFTNEQMYQFLANDKEIYRVYCTTFCFNPQMLFKYHIENLAGETPIQSSRFVKFLQKAGNYNYQGFSVIFPPYQAWQVENPPVPNSIVMGEANVKYVASTYPLENPRLSFKKQFEDTYVYENLDYKPRAYFENPNIGAKISKYTPNEITIVTGQSQTNEKLIIAQNYYPGWYAYINGQKYPTSLQNATFEKVTILPNNKIVELKYQPTSFLIGKTITLGTILFLGMYFWYSRKKKTNQN